MSDLAALNGSTLLTVERAAPLGESTLLILILLFLFKIASRDTY